MADKFGVYDVRGKLQAAVSQSMPGTQNIVTRLDKGHLVTEFLQTDLSGYDDFTFSFLVGGANPTNTQGIKIGDVIRWQYTRNGRVEVGYFDIIEVGLYDAGFGNLVFIKIAGGFDFSTMTTGYSSGSVFRAPKYEPIDTRPKGLNERRKTERQLYNKIIQGKALKQEVGEAPPPGYTNSYTFAGPTVSSYGGMNTDPPSWTQIQVGNHSEFVAAPVSASQHEKTVLNTFLSGTQKLESTPVPASGNMFYSKQNRLVRLTYKLSASALLAPQPDFYVANPNVGATDPLEGLQGDDTVANWPLAWDGSTWPTTYTLTISAGWTGGNVHLTGTDSRGVTRYDNYNTSAIAAGGGVVTGTTYFQTLTNLRLDSGGGPGASWILNEGPLLQLTGAFGAYNAGSGPSKIEYSGSRNTFTAGSGSYRNTSAYNPAVFSLNIPDYGRIRDVKVWVELIHDHRGGPGTGSADLSNIFWHGGSGSTGTDLRMGLQGLQIALRSPNVVFPTAHPHWNSQVGQGFLARPDSSTYPEFNGVPDLLRSSYLLWDGHAVSDGLGTALGNLTSSKPDAYLDVTTISTGTVYNLFGNNVSIVTDKLNRAHALWLQNGAVDTQLAYGRFGSSGWSIKIISGSTAASFNPGEWNRIQVTSNNQPRIVWTDKTSSGGTPVKFAYSNDDGATWTTEIVKSASLGGFPVDMVLDNTDTPMVAYVGFNDGIVHFAKRMGVGNWKDEVASVGGVGSSNVDDTIGIALDSQQRPHILYANNDESRLRHSVSGTNGWTTEYAPFEPSSDLKHLDCVFDSSDKLHVALRYDGLNFAAKYFTSGTSGWLSSSLSEPNDGINGGGGDYTRIALDSSGKPVFVWQTFEDTFSQLRIAKLGPNGLSKRVLAKTGSGIVTSVRGTADVTFDSLGNIHGIYIATENGTSNAKYFTSAGAVQTINGIKQVVAAPSVSSSMYQDFDTDIDMRTIFTDSSIYANPRHNLSLNNGTSGSFVPGRKLIQSSQYASPTSATLLQGFKYQFTELTLNSSHFMSGANFPWMLDDSVPPGNFTNRNHSFVTSSDGTVSATSSLPPPGWLTGPGNTAAVNEWSTRGMQIGPPDIKPVYPMLDDVTVEKKFFQNPLNSVATPSQAVRVVGVRPGLRGTEIHGVWQLLIGNCAHVSSSMLVGTERGGFWFRQFRLEFLVDQGRGPFYPTNPGRSRKYSKPNNVPASPGRRLVNVVSGSATWDVGANEVYTEVNEDYGRSFGITDSTGSANFAVFSQLTGSLVDILSGSGQLASVRSTFLRNEFGTPYIPLSVGSAVSPSLTPFTPADVLEAKQVFSETLDPKTLVPRDNTLTAHVVRSQVLRTTRDALIQKLKKT